MDPSPIPPHVAWMRIAVTLITLPAAILILTAPNFLFTHVMDEGIQKLAAAWIGAVITYWLS